MKHELENQPDTHKGAADGMDELRGILLAHMKKYPLMEPRDAAKLLYQGEFGGGHLLSDRGSALKRLKSEIEQIKQTKVGNDSEACFPAEMVSPDIARLNLNGITDLGLSEQTIVGLFAETCQPRGAVQSLRGKLALMADMARRGEAPFSLADWQVFASQWEAAGFPAVSHSEAYRAAYHPAYRLIPAQAVPFLGLFRAIDGHFGPQNGPFSALNGPISAPKNTHLDHIRTLLAAHPDPSDASPIPSPSDPACSSPCPAQPCPNLIDPGCAGGEARGITVKIDGDCASGKTTLAELLGRVYGAYVFHMDDYFLPIERKTPERLAKPGGNVDRERFAEEIDSVPVGSEVVYRPFSCQEWRLMDPIRVPGQRLRIVEGSYSQHPALRRADISVFLSVDPALQRQRILTRNGPDKLIRFEKEWIPMEKAYFSAFSTREKADFVYDVDGNGAVRLEL